MSAYRQANPDRELIKLGIGDVTRPLAPAVVAAMRDAVEEMGREETFRGYPPYRGYDFLLEAIAEHDYRSRGIELSPEEIFVSDGAKSDCGNIGDIFGPDNRVAVCDPVYPVYVDTNAMAGRAGEYDPKTEQWSRLIYMPCTRENGFLPQLPAERADLIYLCFPNNPTGAAATRAQLQQWVDYANEHGSVILYDSAYEAFITQEDIPHSIYEVEGAKKCAIEFRSFSKTAGFTGTRCAYTVIPKELVRGGCVPERDVVPPPVHEIQRSILCGTEGRRSHLYAGRAAAGEGDHWLLPEQRPGDPGWPGPGGAGGVRRGELPLYLGQDSGRHGLLGVLRPAAHQGQCGYHPRRGLWSQRRRVHPGDLLWRRGCHPPGGGTGGRSAEKQDLTLQNSIL